MPRASQGRRWRHRPPQKDYGAQFQRFAATILLSVPRFRFKKGSHSISCGPQAALPCNGLRARKTHSADSRCDSKTRDGREGGRPRRPHAGKDPTKKMKEYHPSVRARANCMFNRLPFELSHPGKIDRPCRWRRAQPKFLRREAQEADAQATPSVARTTSSATTSLRLQNAPKSSDNHNHPGFSNELKCDHPSRATKSKVSVRAQTSPRRGRLVIQTRPKCPSTHDVCFRDNERLPTLTESISRRRINGRCQAFAAASINVVVCFDAFL